METIKIADIEAEIIRKKIKNVYLRVESASGSVKITAPSYVTIDFLQRFLASKYDWILKQKYKLIKKDRQVNAINYTSGTLISLWGKDYPLVILKQGSRKKIKFIDGKIVISTPMDLSQEEIKKLLESLYRNELENALEQYIPQMEMHVRIKASEYRIKKMKTRWGTCNIIQRRIWINLYLAKYPIFCLEYILVHELVHLYERYHNKRFWSLVEYYYPNWREIGRAHV